MSTDHPPTVDELLDHVRFLRGVARSLVVDRGAAEDLVQDTWVTAIERPPRHSGNPRGWLVRVLKNRAFMRKRAGDRRTARERTLGASRSAAAAVDVAADLETQRRLVRAVDDLDEPYRTVVVLRYFRELPPAEIADRLGVPVKTVYTRLRRANDRLRDRLERDYSGTGRNWRDSLLVLAGGPGGILVMTTTKKLAVGIALVAFLAVGSYLGLPRAREEAEPSAPPAPMPEIASVADTEAPPAPPALASAEPEWTLHVTVRKDSGRPVREARVVFLGEGDPIETKTDRGGKATLAVRGSGDLGVEASFLSPHLTPGLEPPDSGERTVEVVLTDGLRLKGRVLDDDGMPLTREDRVRVIAVPLDPDRWYERDDWEDTTGSEGQFSMRDLPPGRFRLDVRMGRGAPGRPPDPPLEVEAGDTDVTIRLDPALGFILCPTDSATGEPVTSPAKVKVEANGKSQETIWSRNSGKLKAYDLPARTVTITVAADGYQPTTRELTAIPGRPETEVPYPLEADEKGSGRLLIIARDDRGRSVMKLWVGQIHRHESGGESQMSSPYEAPGGRVEIPLPAGSHEILVRGENGYRTFVLKVEIEPGKTVTREVDLALGATILLPPGHSGAVDFFREDGRRVSTSYNRQDDGTVRYRGLPPGKVTIKWYEGGEERSTTVEVASGEERLVRLKGE